METELRRAFGEILKELRQAKKLSQAKLAEYSDLDETYISLMERGHRNPSLKTLFKLSTVLEVRTSELIGLVEEKIM